MNNNLELIHSSAAPAPAIEPVRISTRPLSAMRPAVVAMSNNAPAETDWQRALLLLRNNWRLSGLFMLAIVTATMMVSLLMKPVYEPEAKIELDPPGHEIFSLQSGGDVTADAEYLETQSQKLQSDELAMRVIRALHLDQNAEFAGKLAASAVVSKMDLDSGSAPTLTPAENAALRSFHSKLQVRRDTSSHLVFLKFASHDPVLAPTVVNTLIDQYVETTFEMRHKAIAQSAEWLTRELDDVRQRLTESTKVLARFQQTSGVADVGDNRSTLSEQMGELDRQLGQAQAERIQGESYLRQINSSGAAVLPQVRNNPVVQSLVQKRAEVESELAQASVIYGANHPNVKKLNNQAGELEEQIAAQRDAIVSELKSNVAASRAREELLAQRIQDTTKELNKVAQYNNLKKEVQANSDLYNGLFAKIKEAGISAASKSNNLRVIDRARVLDKPTRPRILFNLLGSVLFGLIGGLFIAFGRERLESHVHTADDVRKITGSCSIAMIPEFAPLPGTARLRRLAGINPLGSAPKPSPAEKFLLSRPNSPEAEAMRSLYTSVMLTQPDNPPKALLIASPFQGEGKTTVAINLAIALSQRSRTVLVDADLRRPGVALAFGLATNRGLSDVLLNAVRLDEVLVPSANIPNLFVLPAGISSAPAARLACSREMREAIERLREQFEHIVIDSPPILSFADGRALSPLVDGVILVGRSGSTTRQALTRSMELLSEVHSAPVLDVVLNGASNFNFPAYGYSAS